MARKKSTTPLEKTWQEYFEPPGLEAFRAVQRSIDQMRPAGIDSFIDATKRMQELSPLIDYGAAKYNLVNIPEMSFFREFHAANDNLQKVIDQLNSLRPLITDFDFDDEDDLEATEFELLPEPQIIIPEQKILLVKETTHIEKIIAGIYKDNRELHHIHHREFEEMVAELLKSRGFEVHLTKQTRDGGTDIIALQDIAGSPFKFLVECKKYAPNRKVGVDIVRGFSYVINTQQANKGLIFTTSYFTADAQKEQQKNMPYLLDLKDQDDILNWVKRYVE
jgi:HJR/Mrr/RecB family endonuclease